MYIGTYYHKLEAKNRLSLPAAFRKAIGKTAVVTRGLDGCLFVFDQETWAKELAKISSLEYTKKHNRDFIRLLTNEAQEIELDGQGRMLVPTTLLDGAGLEKDVVVVGSMDRLEVWNQTTYHMYLKQIEQNAEATAEHIELKAGING